MAYNGAGLYVLPAPEYPAVPGTTILAEDYNTVLADLAAALSSVLVRDGQSAMTGNINMGGFGLTSVTSLTGLTAITAGAAGITVNGSLTFAVGGTLTFNGTANFLGTTTVPTKAAATNTTDAASCAFVQAVAMNAALPLQSLGFLRSDAVTAGFTQTHTGYAQKEVKGADIVCAATIDLTAATGNLVHVTGSTGPVTAFTVASGAEYTIVWDAAPTITHSATLILPTAGNLTVAAGDVWKVRGDGAAARVVDIEKASGAALTVTTPGMILLATLTPTAAANVDFLTTFTASYDSYLIKGHGIQGSLSEALYFRFANAGVVDSAANYYSNMQNGGTSSAVTFGVVSPVGVPVLGVGCNFSMVILNANDPVKLKGAKSDFVGQSAALPTFQAHSTGTAYIAASTISGIRFFWSAGTTFAAQGKIRIYGISNT